jgi:hypothetical protein
MEPEFVLDADEEHQRIQCALTGWETIVFQVGDEEECGGQAPSPVLIAPE